MAEVRSYGPGTPCWVDSSSDDVDASKGFYTSLFGWDAEDQFDPGSGQYIYTLFLLGGRKVAGLGGKPPGFEQMPNVWNTSFATSDVEAAVGRVADAGGQVLMRPLDVMDQGRMAACLDPTGAGFVLWQPGSMRGAELVDEPGAFTWAELMTSDVESATSFYGTLLGGSEAYGAMDVPTVGRMAGIVDPVGAVFSIVAPET